MAKVVAAGIVVTPSGVRVVVAAARVAAAKVAAARVAAAVAAARVAAAASAGVAARVEVADSAEGVRTVVDVGIAGS